MANCEGTTAALIEAACAEDADTAAEDVVVEPAFTDVLAEALAEDAGRAPPTSAVAGMLFTWGRGTHGQLGQSEQRHPDPNCALPHPVALGQAVVHISCGGGQQGVRTRCCFAAHTLR